eukprot:431704_1
MIQLILSVVLTFGNSCASTSTINYDYYYFWGENTLNCNNNVDCIVNCYGNNACDSTTINGPDGAVLTINCDSLFQKHDEEEGKACSNMIIKADNSTKLYINIHNVDFEFISNKIYVPAHNNNSENNTFITCGVVGVNNNHQLAHYSCTQNNTIYSVNGWKSIQWVFTSNISLSVSNTNIMYCNQNYSDSCSVFDVDGLYYHCNDTESPCDYIRSNQTIPSISVSSKQPLFTKQSANNNFIFVKNIEMNFWLARQYCQQTFDTSLASIYNQQQNDEIFNLVNTFSNQSVWIGATDVFFQDNIWNWTETMNGLNYTNWNYTQPDYKFNEDCAIMLNINNNDKWADADCSNHLLNFVCAMPNVTYSPTSAMISLSPTVSPSKSPTFPPVQPQGYKYPFYWSHYHNFIWVDHIANWWTAALICKNDFGASFASIHSVHDNTEAYEVCRDKNCWIGGTDNYGSSWQWDDHTSFDYSNWMRNDVKQTHCIKFINGSDEWTTHLCSDASFTFLCAEFPTPLPTEVSSNPTATTSQPSKLPSKLPTKFPTNNPSNTPTKFPTYNPSESPTITTITPTKTPSKTPTDNPTSSSNSPTYPPIADPTIDPTTDPTNDPTHDPTAYPTKNPTHHPTSVPTFQPTTMPTDDPTTDDPTSGPTTDPTTSPTTEPTISPTNYPSADPTIDPTSDPTTDPTV